MTKRKGIRKIVSLVTAGIMAVSLFTMGNSMGIISNAADPDLDSANLVNYSTVLGRAVDFGITAASMQQKGHMETPIAVKLFENSGSNNDVDLAGSDPVHFIIGELKGDSQVILGKAYSDGMIYNVETTPEVKSKVVKHTNCNAEIKYNIADKTTINKNIDRVIEHIQDESKKLAAKTGINLSEVYTISNHTLNLTDSKYKDKTVYVDLTKSDEYTKDLLKQTANTDQLIIQKYSSTVVVFNMPDSNGFAWDGNIGAEVATGDLKINKYIVKVWDGTTLGSGITSGDQGNSGNDSQHNRDIDAEICQKVIWNFPTATKLEINNTAGAFLVPNKDAFVDVNTSAGWVATAGYLENSGEWHYIYHGRSNDVNEGEGIGQMHFAARKAFTESYTTVKEDTTITMKEGDYKFTLYKTGSNYNTSAAGVTVVGTAQNDAQSKIKFPTLSFETAGTHYYVIKEQNPGVVKNGVKNSDGEIDIKLVVAIDSEGTRTFTITSNQYLSAADKAANKVYKSNKDIVMSGVEFSLGGFYNQIVKDVGSLEITKTVTGVTPIPTDKEFSYTVKNGSGTVVATGKIKANETKTIEGLEFGTYTVTEDTASAQIDKYTLKTSSKTSGSAKIATAGETKTVALQNDYEAQKGSLSIKKTVVKADATTPSASKTYRFSVKNEDGQYVKDTTGALSSTQVYLSPITANGTITINNLPVGNYTIEEEDARITDYTLTVTGLGEVEVKDKATTSVTVDNKYETPKKKSGNLSIVKKMTTDSDPIDGKKFPISVAFDTTGSYAVDGSMVSFTANVPKVFMLGTTGSIEISDILEGVKYTINEDLTGTEYKGYTKQSIECTNNTYTIVDGQKDTVTVTNKYKKPAEKGSLKLVKTIKGNINKEEAEGAITFKVTKKSTGTSQTYSLKDFTLADGVYTKTIDNLDNDTYIVEEVIVDANNQKKLASVTYKIDSGSAISEYRTGDIVINGTTVTVSYENTYSDEDASTTTEQKSTDKDDTTKQEKTTEQEKTSEQVTTEQVTTAATTATITTETVTTTEDISSTKKKTSSKKKGNLIITIYDEKTGGVVPGAKITVTSPSGKETNYTTDENGQVSIKNTAAGDYTVTVTDVPKGYTVTENAEKTVTVATNKTTKAIVKIDKEGDVSVSSKTTNSATKTGDSVPIVPMVTLFVLAILGLILLVFARKQDV